MNTRNLINLIFKRLHFIQEYNVEICTHSNKVIVNIWVNEDLYNSYQVEKKIANEQTFNEFIEKIHYDQEVQFNINYK